MMSFSMPWRRQETAAPPAPRFVDDDPLRALLKQERYGQLAGNPDRWREQTGFDAAYRSALAALDENFAVVPEGYVSMGQTISDRPGGPEIDFETEPFLIARCTVTNSQYQKFVDAGGYQDLELWPEEIWPHLMGFKDQTAQPGPRFWQGGRHPKNKGEHPVVGVSFYEAAAYVRWAGYRLTTEAEWQMAASWRIRSSAHVFRAYPWGDAVDLGRCNLWGSVIGDTVPVDRYPEGAAPNGARQLIGNVWEWTSSTFEVYDEGGRPIVGATLMKAVRGGAYDTYFASQATADFRTALGALSRTHNTGIRAALDVGHVRA